MGAKKGVESRKRSNQIQLQQGIECLSFDINDEQNSALDFEMQLNGNQAAQLIQVIRGLFSRPNTPIHERDSLEELLRPMSFTIGQQY